MEVISQEEYDNILNANKHHFEKLFDIVENWEQRAFINLLENNISDSQNHINVLPLNLQNKLNSYWFTYDYDDCFILHFPGCFRDNNEHGLSIAMNTYCPIKMDNETDKQYEHRLNWLKFESREQ